MWREGAHLATAEAGLDTQPLRHMGDVVLSHNEAAAKVIGTVVSAKGQRVKQKA